MHHRKHLHDAVRRVAAEMVELGTAALDRIHSAWLTHRDLLAANPAYAAALAAVAGALVIQTDLVDLIGVLLTGLLTLARARHHSPADPTLANSGYPTDPHPYR